MTRRSHDERKFPLDKHKRPSLWFLRFRRWGASAAQGSAMLIEPPDTRQTCARAVAAQEDSRARDGSGPERLLSGDLCQWSDHYFREGDEMGNTTRCSGSGARSSPRSTWSDLLVDDRSGRSQKMCLESWANPDAGPPTIQHSSLVVRFL